MPRRYTHAKRAIRILYPDQVAIMNKVGVEGGNVIDMRNAIGYDKQAIFERCMKVSGYSVCRVLQRQDIDSTPYLPMLMPEQVDAIARIIYNKETRVEDAMPVIKELLDGDWIGGWEDLKAALRRTGYRLIYQVYPTVIKEG